MESSVMDLKFTSGIHELPKDVWGLILQDFNPFEVIFVRATNSTLYKWCKEYKPFPKHFVLDQDKFAEYLVQNGLISCVDYINNNLHIQLTGRLCSIAARSGQVQMLDYLKTQGLAYDPQKIIVECAQNTCDLSMIKYLHENGASWENNSPQRPSRFGGSNSINTPMEYMAYHGHLDCIMYAMENGCTQRVINYTPSIECLDFAIQNGFDWKGESKRDYSLYSPRLPPPMHKPNICEEAARLGDLTMLKYAHLNGAPLYDSAKIAASSGHIECLIYAHDRSPRTDYYDIKTIECFKYLYARKLIPTKDLDILWSNQIRNGNIDVLRFMNEIDMVPLPDQIQKCLTESFGKFEVFKFLVDELKVPCDSINPFSAFAKQGNREALQFAFDRNIPLYTSTSRIIPRRPSAVVTDLIKDAIQSKKVEALELVWDKLIMMTTIDDAIKIDYFHIYAAKVSSPEIMDFFTQKGVQWTTEHLADASEGENLQTMAYLTRLGCKWNDTACYNSSALCAKYAAQHGCTKFIKSNYNQKPFGAPPPGPEYQNC